MVLMTLLAGKEQRDADVEIITPEAASPRFLFPNIVFTPSLDFPHFPFNSTFKLGNRFRTCLFLAVSCQTRP